MIKRAVEVSRCPAWLHGIEPLRSRRFDRFPFLSHIPCTASYTLTNSDRRSHTLTPHSEEEGDVLRRRVTTTGGQRLRVGVLSSLGCSARGASRRRRYRPTENALTGNTESEPRPRGALASDAHPGLEIYCAEGNLHTSQPVPLDTSVGSASSFPVVLEEKRGGVIVSQLRTGT